MKICKMICTFLICLLVTTGCAEESSTAADGNGWEERLEPGFYDFYGTFSDNPIYTDGSGDCAIPSPLKCPSVTQACIYRLQVMEPDDLGVQEIRGCTEKPGEPRYEADCRERFWNVAVGKVYMIAFLLSDWDGNGQVTGRLDPLGDRTAALSETDMVVEEKPGPGPGFMIASWSTELENARTSPPGTLVLTIPYQNNLKPPPPPDAPPGTYSPPASTTLRAVAAVNNPEAGETVHIADGTPLSCSRARLVTPHAILRTVIGGVSLGSDVLSITTWDGTFCRRDDPRETCVPKDFPCPALDD